MKKVTFTIEHPGFDDSPKGIEDTSQWEQNELRRLWSNALGDLEDVIARCVGMHQRIAAGENVRHTAAWNNVAGDLADATSAASAYATLIDAVHHRHALAKHGEA